MNVITVKRRVFRKGDNDSSRVRRSFRELTRSYFANEKRLECIIEILLFAAIVALSAWPVFVMVDALNQFLQRAPS